jgi:hypothetical protein
MNTLEKIIAAKKQEVEVTKKMYPINLLEQ